MAPLAPHWLRLSSVVRNKGYKAHIGLVTQQSN